MDRGESKTKTKPNHPSHLRIAKVLQLSLQRSRVLPDFFVLNFFYFCKKTKSPCHSRKGIPKRPSRRTFRPK
jgi:hypothetical protein